MSLAASVQRRICEFVRKDFTPHFGQRGGQFGTNRMWRRAREFGALVGELSGLSVTYWDERLTSAQAARILKGRGARRRKAKIDVISAQLSLQSYLDAGRQRPAGGDDRGDSGDTTVAR